MLIDYIFTVLIVVPLIIIELMPEIYNIKKTIVIKNSVKEMMSRIGNLNGYALRTPWQKSDPSANKTITRTSNNPGHKYAWEGKKEGMEALL